MIMPASPRSKPLLVGESNPYRSDPHFALYPAPDGCSGHRLCRLILKMGRRDYLEAVCSAFGVRYRPFETCGVRLVLPHPSGRCRLWNAPSNYGRVRAAVRLFLPEVAHLLDAGGEGDE